MSLRTRRFAGLLLAAGLVAAACTQEAAPPEPPPQSFPAALRFAAVGDIGQGNAGQAEVAAAIAAEHEARPIELLVLLGDLIYPRGNPAQFEEKFAVPYEPVFDAGIPLVPVLGNHDLQTDTRRLMERFGMEERYSTLRRGPVELFVIDNASGSVTATQRRWLDDALAASTAPWKIPVMHVPLYSSGMHGSSHTLQRALEPLFVRHGVRFVLAGHDHNYERTRPIKGITYIVSGGGCCPRRVSPGRISAVAVTGLHFVTVDATEVSLTVRAVRSDGEVLDEAVLGLAAASPAA